MARTYSIDIDLGTKAPEFELRDTVTNNLVNLYDVKGEKKLKHENFSNFKTNSDNIFSLPTAVNAFIL